MKLLSIWNERVQDALSETRGRRISYGLQKSPRYYARKTNFIDTVDGAQAMLDFALQRPLSHIGFDTEFGGGEIGFFKVFDFDHFYSTFNPEKEKLRMGRG